MRQPSLKQRRCLADTRDIARGRFPRTEAPVYNHTCSVVAKGGKDKTGGEQHALGLSSVLRPKGARLWLPAQPKPPKRMRQRGGGLQDGGNIY